MFFLWLLQFPFCSDFGNVFGFYLYSVYPCIVETLRGSICGFSNTLFTLCPFETKRGTIFIFGPGL
jgi:hypothetical protein